MPYDPMQVYQPEVDTYLLLEAARKEVKSGDRVLEVGTGSGIISRELTKLAGIVATDINPHAVLCASRAGIEVVRTDLVCGLRGSFDLILFNPPYLPTKPGERIDDWLEYALDGGESGRSVIERFALTVDDVLAPEGRILLLISSLTGLYEVQELFAGQGYTAGIVVQQVIEDEVIYVLKVIRKDGGNPAGLLVHLGGNNDNLGNEDHTDNYQPFVKERHVREEECRGNETGRGHTIEPEQLPPCGMTAFSGVSPETKDKGIYSLSSFFGLR